MEDKLKHKAIETYADDLAGVLEAGEEGLVRKLIHEQEKLEKEAKTDSPESKKNKKFLVIGIALILLGVLSIYFIFTQNKKKSVSQVAPEYKPVVFVEKNEFKDITGLTKEEVGKVISTEALRKDIKKGTIEALYLTENKQTVLGVRKTLSALASSFYPSEEEYLNDNFLMGTFYGEGNDFFMILEVSALVDIFDSMKKWEKNMFKELSVALGTTINAENNYLLIKPFEDYIFENKNARVLRDNDGNVILIYLYVKDNFVVITEGEETAREVLLRLSGAEIKK